MNILLLQLEFSRWKTARPWTYPMNFGIAQVLKDIGNEVFTIPVIPDQNLDFRNSWLGHAQDLCYGKKFDQVWVWLLHYPFEQDTLDWIRTMAPIRVGILGESMRYDLEDYAQEPSLYDRPTIIRHQAQCLTHILVGDEHDEIEISRWGNLEALWCPGGVPQQAITTFVHTEAIPCAVFHGSPYGSRVDLLRHPRLRQLLKFPQSRDSLNEFPQLFDGIQTEMEKTLVSEQGVTEHNLHQFVMMLGQVRFGEFRKWMRSLQAWAVIVNLPSYAKFYGGRVFEGLASGRPVITWDIPDHPRNHALFQDEEEILIFPKNDPEVLANHIDRLLSDSKLSARLVWNAQRKLQEFHTVEKRVADVLQWVKSGTKPWYETRSEGQVFSLNAPDVVVSQPNTIMGQSMLDDLGNEKRIETVQKVASPETPDVYGLVRSSVNQEGLVNMASDQVNQRNQEDQFYSNLFIRSGNWSTPTPNTDESMRWGKIKSFLPEILERLSRADHQPVRILDVGCGRGWLTNLLSEYGCCEGIEPVEAVVEYGRRLFPHLVLHVGFPDELLNRPSFQPYDLIVSSEVIEHIPHDQKTNFVHSLQKLMKPNGAIILTTPRMEVWDQWRTVSTPNQPIEDWITENDLLALFKNLGFQELGRERIYFDLPRFEYVETPQSKEKNSSSKVIALYQIWAFGFGPIFQDRVKQGSFPKGEAMDNQKLQSPRIDNPLVSVIVPTFNRRPTLKVALESIMRQTFADYEIIVINDAGVDVEDIVTSFNARNNVTSIRHGRNLGLAAARNSGLGLARGKYIAYLDDDDRFASHHLETLVAFLEQSHYQVAYTDAWQIMQRKEHGEYIETGRSVPYSQDFNRDMLLISNCFPVLCMMHEKACLEKTGIFDETLTTHEDWDLWIRMSRHYTFAHLKEVTAEFTWRMDGSSMTSRISEDFLRTKQLIYQKYEEYFRLQPHLISVRDQRLGDLENRANPPHFECSIIIPVFNKLELTKQCLMYLAQVTIGIPYEVVVVDNHSTDGTSEFLETLGGDVQIIRNPTNLGFAKACNQGAHAARGKYLVFLNNDTIPKPGWLEPLIQEVYSHDDVAVVGSKLLYPDNSIQHAGVVISRLYRTPYHLFLGVPESLPAVNTRKEFQAVTAACMLVRKEPFEAVGGFDEGFVNGFEDVDLCLKIRHLGKKVVYQPKSCLYHLESQTPGRKTHDEANAKRLLARWEDEWLVDEDLAAYQSGYTIQQFVSDEKLQSQLIPIKEVADATTWDRIVELQKLLLGQKCQPLAQMAENHRIWELLGDVDAWPNDIGILEWIGRVCETLQCQREAINCWKKLLTLGDHPNARLGMTRAMLKKGILDEAQRHLDVLKDVFTLRGEVCSLQGILFMQRQEYFKAKNEFEQALKFESTHTKARMGLGMACMGLNQSAEAWSAFEQVLSVDPDHCEAIRCLIQAGTALQYWKALVCHLDRFIERNPANCDMRFALAGVQYRAGYFDKAKEHLNWLRLIRPDYDGLEDLGNLLQASLPQENLVSIR